MKNIFSKLMSLFYESIANFYKSRKLRYIKKQEFTKAKSSRDKELHFLKKIQKLKDEK